MGNIFTTIGKNLSKVGNGIGFWTRKRSPELLVAGAIIAAAGSVVLAIKATTKLEKVSNESKEEIDIIKLKLKEAQQEGSDVKTFKSELTKSYAKASFKIAKLYIPTAITFTLFLAGILSSHKIMKGRNFALASAYSLLHDSYKGYRGRVKNAIGDDKENDIYHNRYDEQVEVLETDKNGKMIVKSKKAKVAHINKLEPYSFLFGSNNPNHENQLVLSLEFLMGTEKFLNTMLVSKGYLFLHDVYDALGVADGDLGIKRAQASRVIGWIYDPTNRDRSNYISFGLSDAQGNYNKRTMDSIRNKETEIVLDFNPDGDILNGNMNFAKFARQ